MAQSITIVIPVSYMASALRAGSIPPFSYNGPTTSVAEVGWVPASIGPPNTEYRTVIEFSPIIIPTKNLLRIDSVVWQYNITSVSGVSNYLVYPAIEESSSLSAVDILDRVFTSGSQWGNVPKTTGLHAVDFGLPAKTTIQNAINNGDTTLSLFVVIETKTTTSAIFFNTETEVNQILVTCTYYTTPYQNRLIFRENFYYKGYSSDVTYATGQEPLPSVWEAYPANSFSVGHERDLQVLQPGELIYEGSALDIYQNDENYSVSFDFFGTEGLIFEIRSRRIEGSDGTDYVALETDFANNRFRFKEVIASTVTEYDWIAHEFTVGQYYRAGLWLFEDAAIATYNGGILGSQALSSITTHKGFSLYVSAYNEDTFFEDCRVHELIPQPDPSLESDDSDLYVRFRKEIIAQIENVQKENWEAFKAAHKLYMADRCNRYTNPEWWWLGYPVSEPSTEEWLKP